MYSSKMPVSSSSNSGWHYLICAWCKRYFKQLTFLHQAAPHFEEHAGIVPSRGLSAEARQRIMQRLQAVEKKSS